MGWWTFGGYFARIFMRWSLVDSEASIKRYCSTNVITSLLQSMTALVACKKSCPKITLCGPMWVTFVGNCTLNCPNWNVMSAVPVIGIVWPVTLIMLWCLGFVECMGWFSVSWLKALGFIHLNAAPVSTNIWIGRPLTFP